MEEQSRIDVSVKGRLSRRRFLGKVASAAAGFSIVPRRVLGGPGYVPPSEKVNIAFIGVGSQGLRVMLSFLKQPDVQAVSVCDPNKGSGDYPQWGEHEFRDSVRRVLGVGSGWDWLWRRGTSGSSIVSRTTRFWGRRIRSIWQYMQINSVA